MKKDKKTLDDIVYEKLKKAIMLNKFPPNYKLVESEIADILNVSRTPVHTALKLLERDGLLAIIPNKGAFVTKKTYDEIKDAFAVRVEIEKMSVRIASERASHEDIERLEQILEKEKNAYMVKNRAEAYTLGADFHKAIAKITGNKCLYNYVKDIIIKTDIYDVFYILNDPMLEKQYFTPDQHHDILEALRQKDASKSVKAIEEHIKSTEAQLNLISYEGLGNIGELKL